MASEGRKTCQSFHRLRVRKSGTDRWPENRPAPKRRRRVPEQNRAAVEPRIARGLACQNAEGGNVFQTPALVRSRWRNWCRESWQERAWEGNRPQKAHSEGERRADRRKA